ncbi:MAG: nucleoside triphosphate pyrophosphohydrolase [Clostridiales bacterium]|nr:nucleoside triphosphate pyrophosphohydrolase [Clostridiales bacterium]
MNLTLIGMGNKEGDCTLSAFSAIRTAQKVYVRAETPHIVRFLKEQGVAYETLTAVYLKSRNFDTLYKNIAKEVLAAAKTQSVCYLVDGCLREDRAAQYILKRHRSVNAEYGVSKACAVFTPDETLSYQTVSAYDLSESERYITPLAVYDIDDGFLASEVKLLLSSRFGEEITVTYYANGKKKQIPLYELDRQKIPPTGAVVFVNRVDFFQKDRYDFYDLTYILTLLRGENGCPWDRVQTHESIRGDLIEECYELIDAIDNRDVDNMEEETGDVLLQAAFHAQIGTEEGEFTVDDVTTRLCKKLIFRHSHVFGEDKAASKEEALAVWNKNKKIEHGEKAVDEMFRFAAGLPQLTRAEKTKKRCRKVGFDWTTQKEVWDKVLEEIREIEELGESPSGDRIREECGDFLLAAACAVAHYGLSPELALKEGVDKFQNRFRKVAALAEKDGKALNELSVEEYDGYWNLSKKD